MIKIEYDGLFGLELIIFSEFIFCPLFRFYSILYKLYVSIGQIISKKNIPMARQFTFALHLTPEHLLRLEQVPCTVSNLLYAL